MDYEIRLYLYNSKLKTILKLYDMTVKHSEQQDTPLNRLALAMAEHHVERCSNACSLS